MKKAFIVVLLLILVNSFGYVKASIWTSPYPETWKLELATYKVVTNFWGNGYSDDVVISGGDSDYDGFVIQMSGGFHGNYEVILQRSAHNMENWSNVCGSGTNHDGNTNLIQFGPTESEVDQPFDDYISCDNYVVGYDYRIRVKENSFGKLTTYVTIWSEELD